MTSTHYFPCPAHDGSEQHSQSGRCAGMLPTRPARDCCTSPAGYKTANGDQQAISFPPIQPAVHKLIAQLFPMSAFLYQYVMSRRQTVSEVTHRSLAMAFRFLLILVVCSWTSLAEARLAGDHSLLQSGRGSMTPLQLARRIKLLRRIREARAVEQAIYLQSPEDRRARQVLPDTASEAGTSSSTGAADVTSSPSSVEPTAQAASRPSCHLRRSKASLNNRVEVTLPGCERKIVKVHVCQGRCKSVSYAVYSAENGGGSYKTHSECCQPTQMKPLVVQLQCTDENNLPVTKDFVMQEAAACGCS